ncbi:MAG: response regulator [Acidobacteriota bacterium]
MPLLTIQLLGDFAALDDGGHAMPIPNARTQALLVYMALQGSTATAGEAALLLTGHDDPGTVAVMVRDLEYALGHLPPYLVVTRDGALRFDGSDVSVDALEFEDAAFEATMNGVRLAAEIYSGNLLEGFTTGVEAFDEWVAAKRVHYWRIALSVFGRLLAAQIKAGWWENATETASRLLSLDPSQEVVHRSLMRLQLEQGRPDSALRRYQECVDILRRDFDREPSAETQRVYEEINAALVRAPAPREAFRSPIGRPVLILVVEDDLVTSALIEDFLNEAGYGVVAVADGADALMEIGRREFDLLLLDINIPTLSGLRLFEIMIQKGIDTPAVFVTGIPGPEVEARSLEMGAADFIRKPVRKEVLIPRLRAILQRRDRAAGSIRVL